MLYIMKRKPLLAIPSLLLALALPAQAQTASRADLANMREDINQLSQQVARMQLTIEELQRQNNELVREINAREKRIREISQAAESRISTLQSERTQQDARLRSEIIAEVTRQIDALGSQTQKAFDELARNMGGPSVQTTTAFEFSNDYPRTGVAYEVRRGDTLSKIARDHNATVRDIQNANKIAEPRELRVGQTIFIPQRN